LGYSWSIATHARRDKELLAAYDSTPAMSRGIEFMLSVAEKVGRSAGGVANTLRERFGLKAKRLKRTARPKRTYCCGFCGDSDHNIVTCAARARQARGDRLLLRNKPKPLGKNDLATVTPRKDVTVAENHHTT